MAEFNRFLYPGETRREWIDRYYTAAGASKCLYRNDGYGLVYINSEAGPCRLMDPYQFQGVAHSVAEVIETFETKDGREYTRPVLFSAPELSTIFGRHQEAPLPILRSAVKEPMILMKPNGDCEVTSPGFNSQGGHNCYYYVPPLVGTIRPLQTTTHLAECFSGVPFEKLGYRNNLIAWLLGAIVLDPLMDTPFLVVSGNQQGIGKSACVQAAGLILSGAVPPPIDFHGGEFMKNISTRFLDNDRLMFLDNIVTKEGKSFDNSQLSTLLTQGYSKKIRILGQSRSVSASGILFAASVNEAKLSADLATRALAVKLYKEVNGPMVPFCRDYAVRHRRELYGELLGLALRPAGRLGGNSHGNFRYRRWLEFVQPRVESVFGPLAIDEVSTLDDVTQELFDFGLDMIDADKSDEFDAEYFLKAVEQKQSSYPALFERLMTRPSQKGRLAAAGRFLSARKDQLFTIGPDSIRLILSFPGSNTEGKRYAFVKEPAAA